MVSKPKINEVKICLYIHLSELSVKSLQWWERGSDTRLRALILSLIGINGRQMIDAIPAHAV